MGQTMIDGIMVGDRFDGNYGVYGDVSPFGIGPIGRSWQFWVRTASIDTYLTLDGLRRTLEFFGLSPDLPIAATPADFRKMVDAGVTMLVKGDPSKPCLFQFWVKKHNPYYRYAGNEMNLWMGAQTIISQGLRQAQSQFDEAMARYLDEMEPAKKVFS